MRPLLVLGTLGLFLYGPHLMKLSSQVMETEDTTVALLFTLPVVLLLMVHFMSELIVIPVVSLVAIFLLRNILIGLLILLLAIQFLGKYYSPSSGCDQTHGGSEGGGEGVGLGCFILVLLFLILYNLFYEGEGHGYGWVSLTLALTFVAFFNMF